MNVKFKYQNYNFLNLYKNIISNFKIPTSESPIFKTLTLFQISNPNKIGLTSGYYNSGANITNRLFPVGKKFN